MDHHLCVFSHTLLDMFRASMPSVVLTFILGGLRGAELQNGARSDQQFAKIFATKHHCVQNLSPCKQEKCTPPAVQHRQLAWWEKTFFLGSLPACLPVLLQARWWRCVQFRDVIPAVEKKRRFILRRLRRALTQHESAAFLLRPADGKSSEFLLRILAATRLDWITLCEVYWHVIFILQTHVFFVFFWHYCNS